MKDSAFKKSLSLKIQDSLDRIKSVDAIKQSPLVESTDLTPLLKYKEEIGELIRNKNYSSLVIKGNGPE